MKDRQSLARKLRTQAVYMRRAAIGAVTIRWMSNEVPTTLSADEMELAAEALDESSTQWERP